MLPWEQGLYIMSSPILEVGFVKGSKQEVTKVVYL